MTEDKRFTLSEIKYDNTIFDDGKALGCIDVVELLNDLSNQNEHFKKCNNHLQDMIIEKVEDKSKLRCKIKQLKKELEDSEFARRTEAAHHRVAEEELKEKNKKLKKNCQICNCLDELIFKDRNTGEDVYFYRCKDDKKLWEPCEKEAQE